MRTRARGAKLVGLVAGLLLLPALASGQETAEPTDFERDFLRYRSAFDYGRFEPDLRSLLPSGTAGTWNLLAGAEGTYTDNLDQDAARREAVWVDGTAGLGWLKVAPRLQASLDYRFRTDLYQSDAVDGRDHTSHRVSGALGWRASPRWTLSGGGYFAQEVETGVEETAPGVRSTFDNRFDEFEAHGSAQGQLSGVLANRTSYAFRDRDYASDDADGDDTRAQRVGSRFDWQALPRDTLGLGYDYAVEDNLTTSEKRQNHLPTASWGHRFLGFPGSRSSLLTASYLGDRALSGDAPNYWNHAADLRYDIALSPRTDVYATGGYQWIRPDEGSAESGPRYGAGLGHRFSEWTAVRFSGSHAWEYVPASSRSDFTTLTKVTRVSGNLGSRLARDLMGEVTLDYEHGDVDPDVGGAVAETDYWEAGGLGSLTAEVSRRAFVGVDYRATRRSTDDSEDDYWLHRAGLFARADIVEWCYAVARYSYESREYDGESAFERYHENRVSLGLTFHL